MKVVGKNILCKEIIETIKTQSGLILGEGEEIKFHKAEVITLGEDISNDVLKVGDIIWFDRHRVYPIVYEGIEYLLFDYSNVVIIEGN